MVLRLGMPLVGGVEETLDGLSIILRETGATLVVVDETEIILSFFHLRMRQETLSAQRFQDLHWTAAKQRLM